MILMHVLLPREENEFRPREKMEIKEWIKKNRFNLFLAMIFVSILTYLISGAGMIFQIVLIFLLLVLIDYEKYKKLPSKTRWVDVIIGIIFIYISFFLYSSLKFFTGSGFGLHPQFGYIDIIVLLLGIAIIFYGFANLKRFLIPFVLIFSLILFNNLQSISFIKNVIGPIFVNATITISSAILNIFGYAIEISGSAFILPNGTAIQMLVWCSGINSVLFYSIFAGILLLKINAKRNNKILAFILGAIGVFFINILRVSLLVAIGVRCGMSLMDAFHTHLGDLLFLFYIGIFWWLAFKFLEESREKKTNVSSILSGLSKTNFPFKEKLKNTKILDSKILKGATWVGIGNVASQALAFLFMVILARFYSKSDYGFIGYVISVGTLATSIIISGYPSALVRFIAKYLRKQEKIDEYFTNIFTIILGLLFASVVGVMIIYKFDIGIISIVIGYSVVYTYLGMIRGFMNYKKIALFNVLRNLVKIIVLVALCYVLFVRSPLFIVLLYAFGGWIAILVLEVAGPTHVHYSPTLISRKTMKEVTAFSIPIMVGMIAYTMLSSIPVIAIKSFYDYEMVGLYSVAMTLTILFTFIPGAITTMTMPKISNVEDKKKRVKYTVQSFWLVLVTGITLYILIFFFGKLGLEIIFTEKYVPSYPILLVLSIGAIFGGLRNVFCALWAGSGHPIIITYDIIPASVVCITLSFLLVPSIGPIGAAYGYSLGLVSAVLVDLIYWIKYRYTEKLNLE